MTQQRTLDSLVKAIAEDATMNDALLAMMGRASEFDSPVAAKLTGIALNPKARDHWEDSLDAMWSDTTIPTRTSEIVVGAGLHAAIYCSVRVRLGHPKPLVIEAKDRAGGTFATARNAVFYLNSRNRPGNLGTPGRGEALNFLPAAPVQPSCLSADDYQPNSALGFSIRAALAMNATVLVGHKVVEADSTGVTLEGGKKIKATRVIYATGLGDARLPEEADGKRLMSYLDFLGHMDQSFPLQGVKRIAVVGAGDAGRTVIEALTGQGPGTNWSVAGLDFVDKIDWYGVPFECCGPSRWAENNRSRYKGISRVLATVNEEGKVTKPNRVIPIGDRAERTGVGYDGAYIDGALYDLVIWAAGFDAMDVSNMVDYRAGGRIVAKMAESGLFVVGPAAQIVDTRENNVPQTVPENTAAVFRYADRTAALAMHLPELELPSGRTKAEPKEGGKGDRFAKLKADAAKPKSKSKAKGKSRSSTRRRTVAPYLDFGSPPRFYDEEPF